VPNSGQRIEQALGADVDDYRWEAGPDAPLRPQGSQALDPTSRGAGRPVPRRRPRPRGEMTGRVSVDRTGKGPPNTMVFKQFQHLTYRAGLPPPIA